MQRIVVDDITLPRVLLRPVDTESIEYQELLDSIREHGLCKPILVRPHNALHQLIDGMHRLTIVKALGHHDIDAVIKDCTEEVAEFLQVQLNACHVETSPLDYAKRLRRIVKANTDKSLAWVSRQVSKSTAWVRKILGLLKLEEKTMKAVERSEIPLQSAYELAKLPRELQERWCERAVAWPAKRFVAEIAATVRAYKDAKHKGRWESKSSPDDPKPYLRSLKEILSELEESKEAAAVLTVEGARTPLECFAAGLKWATHSDLYTLRKH